MKNRIKQCADALRKLHGLPPYNTASNYVAHDPYFAKSIDADYTADEIRMAKARIPELKE